MVMNIYLETVSVEGFVFCPVHTDGMAKNAGADVEHLTFKITSDCNYPQKKIIRDVPCRKVQFCSGLTILCIISPSLWHITGYIIYDLHCLSTKRMI